jgi:hypothetical protein
MADLKNYVTKIMSKSPSRHLVRLQGKLKLAEKQNNLRFYKFYFYFSVFQCTSHQPISEAKLR